ncbi:TonB-dependent receptor [Methylosinus sporium]|uniref:TonB-dependent receptor n=1 Tax=Methylosinus sporium TaxID=428 RepID=A0A549SRD3_METSR|nr:MULTISPECIES: TonB-dependent receptor [Methylosinus]MBU3888326.1 TonB-dependent receptor [Methylosinus sp. KRF6]TRL32168.1 TonB-dependent receptor [Methylosinus sporium]
MTMCVREKRGFSFLLGGASFAALLGALDSASAEPFTLLPDISIGAATAPAPKKKPEPGVIGSDSVSSTAYAADARGLDLASGGGGSNPIRGISWLPSVDAPAIDPYGLANLPGGNKGIRIRGEVSQHGNSIGTVEGLPLSGINPGPGVTWLIDNENLSKIVLRQGPMPSDVNSYFTAGGSFDSRLRWPAEKFGGEISQSVGSFSFLRTFARIDSGEILNGTTKLFVSGSFTDADKWRGSGKDPQGKSGFAVGIDAKPVDGLEAKFFVAKSSFDQHSYQGLNYQQASNLGAFRRYDFAAYPGPTTASQINYYGYNLQHFDSWTAFGDIAIEVDKTTRFVFKPYYFREDGYYLDGQNNGRIRKWIIDHDMWGVVSELQTRVLDTDAKLGFWHGVQNPPGPPTAWEVFAPNAGGGLINPSWAILGKQTAPHVFDSAYGIASRDFGPLHVEAGARYIWERMAGIDAYNSTGIGDVPYDTALALSSGVIANRSVKPFTIGTFLPFGALTYRLTDDLLLKFSGGGGYGGPGYDAWPVFQQNSATFLAKGITADQFWHSMKPETSTQLDLGLRWSFDGAYGSGYVEPTIYYSRNHNKLVSYDPGIGTQYGSNVGESQNYGAQAVVHYSPLESVSLFASLGYQRAEFVEDLPLLPGASAANYWSTRVKGKQLPDVPYFISTIGGDLRIEEFTVTPILHIVGSRAGDTSGYQPLAGYSTFDLTVKYEHEIDWGTITASVTCMNMFDTAYIGQISSGYYQQTSANGIYYPGAPRTVLAKVGFKF